MLIPTRKTLLVARGKSPSLEQSRQPGKREKFELTGGRILAALFHQEPI